METIDCNLCGSADQTVIYRQPDALYFPDEWFNTVQCSRCGLGFVNPRPSREEIGKYYPADFYEYFADADNRRFHLNRYRTEANFVERHLRPGGARRLLDVGCANGDFPRFMRDLLWEVEGVEVSTTSRGIDDFTIYRQEFPEIPVVEPRYDAVTAWAVLEHVHDPMAYFKKAAQVLKSGGVFVFLVTNFESTTSRHLFGEDVPRHLYFFTERAVRQYLERTGFELVDVDYSDKVYGMLPVNWLRYLARKLTGRPFEWRHSRLTHDRYLRDHAIPATTFNKFRFMARHPVSLVDRLLAPVYARYQMLAKKYGIVTYVARRLA